MDRSNGKSETPILVGKFDWDPVPLRFDMELDMDTEFFKSECCEPSKEVELTLAELNDERPMSPLINPEMERLHRIATRAERDLASPCAAFTVPRKAMPYITLELSEQSIKKEDFAPCSGREVKSEGVANGGDSEGSSQRSDNNNPPVTWAVIQPPAENGQITHENYGATQPIKIEVETRSQPCERSASLAQEVGDEFHGATKELEDKGFVVAVKKEKDQELNREPVSADEQEESADEDSDDDFEVDGLSPGSKNRKGRRGDSDDLSPNPQKLLEISKELERLNKVISDLKPIHQLPVNARTRSRKEKNKLASRACRLKKKAQYEANKLKLHGLEVERGRLLQLIQSVKREILNSTHCKMPREGLGKRVEEMVQSTLMGNEMVAGRTAEFVESTLKATARANPWMGIQEVHLNI